MRISVLVLLLLTIETAHADWQSSVARDEFTNELRCAVVLLTIDTDIPDSLDEYPDLNFGYMINRGAGGVKLDFVIERSDEPFIPEYIKIGDTLREKEGSLKSSTKSPDYSLKNQHLRCGRTHPFVQWILSFL